MINWTKSEAFGIITNDNVIFGMDLSQEKI